MLISLKELKEREERKERERLDKLEACYREICKDISKNLKWLPEKTQTITLKGIGVFSRDQCYDWFKERITQDLADTDYKLIDVRYNVRTVRSGEQKGEIIVSIAIVPPPQETFEEEE